MSSMHDSLSGDDAECLRRSRLATAGATVLAAGVPLGLAALVGWLLGASSRDARHLER